VADHLGHGNALVNSPLENMQISSANAAVGNVNANLVESGFAGNGFARFDSLFTMIIGSFHIVSPCGLCGKVSPGPFYLRRLLSCPGNKETGLNDQLNWR
jgi:hypothetical protein